MKYSLILHPSFDLLVKARKHFQFVLGAIEGEPMLAVALRDLQLVEGNHDVLLANANEAADADDRGRNGVAIDDKIGDIANLVSGLIINIRLIDVGGEQMARRRRGTGHGRASSWLVIGLSARASPPAKARTEADKASVFNISDSFAVTTPRWGRHANAATRSWFLVTGTKCLT